MPWGQHDLDADWTVSSNRNAQPAQLTPNTQHECSTCPTHIKHTTWIAQPAQLTSNTHNMNAQRVWLTANNTTWMLNLPNSHQTHNMNSSTCPTHIKHTQHECSTCPTTANTHNMNAQPVWLTANTHNMNARPTQLTSNTQHE